MEARDIKALLENPNDDSYARACVAKWLPMVEDIENRHDQGVTAVLLENEMDHLKKMLSEATVMGNAGEYAKFIFPLVRNVFPHLIANQIASIQPMTAPVGAVFYYKYKYGTTKGTVTAGEEFPKQGNFDTTYSKGQKAVTGEALATGDGTSATFTGVSANLHIVQGTFTIAEATGGINAIDDGNGNLTGAGIASGMINYATGRWVIEYDAAPANASAISGGYSYLLENNSADVSEIYADIEMHEVRAISRKLKALWSSEAADDMRAFHGYDAESELVAGISSEIALEIDREIVDEIVAAVPAGHAKTFSRTVPSGIAEIDHLRSLVTVLSTVSQLVYKATLRRPANWIVTSPEITALLDQLPEFLPASGITEQYNLGMQKAGRLNGKWNVFNDPYHTSSNMTLGYRGPVFMDAGYAYAPYIPLQVTPTFLDPNDFQFKKGMRTRYAKKLVDANFFGKVTVSGL